MKIDIITLSCAINYGAMLQTYALYNVLSTFSSKVKVIDYVSERYDYDHDLYKHALIGSSKRRYFPILRDIWANASIENSKKNRTVFRRFLKDHVELTKSYHSTEELKEDIPHADVYITGSDQVWNPDYLWHGDIDGPYFYDFLPDRCKRISYASSFGKERLTERQILAARPLLEKYSAISVREKSGIQILSDMGLKAAEVLDPTVLAGADCFRSLISGRQWELKPFILLFQINYDHKLFRLTKELAKNKGKEVIIIAPSIQQSHKYKGRVVALPEVEEWLWYFDNAEFIVTDSFHATAFSIMFNKRFASSAFAGLNGRIKNILDIADLQNSLLTAYDHGKLEQIYNTPINYKAVNERVEASRQVSMNWLKKALDIDH